MIMKIQSKVLLLSYAIILVGFNQPVLADEEERPGTEHILGFLKDKMPESLRLLERVREEDGEEGYKEVLEEARDLLSEFLEIRREEGEEHAERFLKFERDRIRLEALLEEWHETDNEDEKRELRDQIAEVVSEQVDREMEEGHQELEKLKEEVREIEEELAELEEKREAIIEAELEKILPGERVREDEDEEPEEERGRRNGGGDRFVIKQTWSQESNFPRPYLVNFPERKNEEALPVIIFLHGNGGNAKGLQGMVRHRYSEIASQFITVFPEGYRESWNIVSERSKADDRGFIESIVRELSKRDDVKKDAFTIMGISNGAALVNQIAIETKLPSIKNYISSVSPLNGFQYDGKNFKAKGEKNDYRVIATPLAGKRILNISGTTDSLVPYGGGPSKAIPAKGGKLSFVDAEESIFLWAKQMGYRKAKLERPVEVKGKVAIFSYLNGDVVHFKVSDHGHNATQALTEGLLLNFLEGK
jgi:poly(3-hydroxybutyrate) depolymerase